MDLDRARRHYQENRFENALALFRVLERDMDSLSRAERTQYAYLRGMTDFRLASGSEKETGSSDLRRSFRSHARYWLGISAALEKKNPGSITPEERERLEEALVELNRDVYGGDAAAADGPAEGPPTEGPTPTPAPQTPALDTPAPETPASETPAPKPPGS
jgi:hypothetical protein